jgi:hypothetical protein
MSATPPDPKPPNDPRKEAGDALVWTLLAAAVAVGLFVYSGQVPAEKKNFYQLAAGVGALVAAYNGFAAWTAYNKTKQPR